MRHPKSEKAPRRADAGNLPERTDANETSDNSEAISENIDTQARPLGRPPGRNSLIGGFDVAMWMAFSDDLGAQDTADLVTLLMSDHPIGLNDVEGVFLKFSTDLRTTSIKSRSGNLLKRCSDISLTLEEANWLTTSADYLRMLASSYLSETMTQPQREVRRRFASDHLIAMGWAGTIERIFLKLKAAVASNAPPNEEPLKRKALAILAHIARSNVSHP